MAKRVAFVPPSILRSIRYTGATTQRRPQKPRRQAPPRAMSTLPPKDTILGTRFPESVQLAHEVLKELPSPLSAGHDSAVRALLETSAGIRGLFVALLSEEDIKAAEEPLHEGLKGVLREAEGEAVVLAVKNVVMSSAMAVTYATRGDLELAEGSRRTSVRAVRVLGVMRGGTVGREMVRGLTEGAGEFAGFASKWGYGAAEIDAAVRGLVDALGEGVLSDV